MPATKKPVRKRRTSATDGPSADTPSAFAAAAAIDDTRTTRRAWNRSGRLVIADASAPVTNPICTAIVSQAEPALSSAHSARSCGSTADAENHVDIESTIAPASGAIVRQRLTAGMLRPPVPFRRRGQRRDPANEGRVLRARRRVAAHRRAAQELHRSALLRSRAVVPLRAIARAGGVRAVRGDPDQHRRRAAAVPRRNAALRCGRHGGLARRVRAGPRALHPVPRRDERRRDVRRGTLRRGASARARPLRPRLQRRVQPVLRLQRELELPAPAARELARGPHPRGREVLPPVAHAAALRVKLQPMAGSVRSETDARGVARITLWRPERKNAFDAGMIAAITASARSVAPDARAVVLASEGDVFCAGADLSWMKSMVDYGLDQNLADSRDLAEMFRALDELPMPLLARVQGAAL